MEKNWLIRTKHKQILGPVSKTKVIELLEKGSLSADDEVTTGSGYWFWIREKDLVDKYLYGDIPQTFNPISEAVDVLCATGGGEGTASINRMPSQPKNREVVDKGAQNLPDSGELDYPSLDDLPEEKEREDVTLVGGIPSLNTSPNKNIPDQVEPEPGVDGKIPKADDLEYPDMEVASGASLEVKPVVQEEPILTLDTDQEISPSSFIKEEKEEKDEEDLEAKMPEQNDLEYPDMGGDESEEELEELEEETEPKKRLPPKEQISVKKAKKSKKVRKKKVIKSGAVPPRNDRYLFYILILIVFLIAAILFYYTKILNRGIPGIGKVEDLIIPKVQAQVILPSSLKKKA